MLRQDAGATFSDKRITVNKPDILLVHRGGLGDFLAAWPAVLSICDQFADHEWFWIGDADRLAWLSPLGVRACPRDLSRAFEELFVSRCWPEAFSETQIYWFGLARRPPVVEHPRLVFLRGLGGGAPCPFARRTPRNFVFTAFLFIRCGWRHGEDIPPPKQDGQGETAYWRCFFRVPGIRPSSGPWCNFLNWPVGWKIWMWKHVS